MGAEVELVEGRRSGVRSVDELAEGGEERCLSSEEGSVRIIVVEASPSEGRGGDGGEGEVGESWRMGRGRAESCHPQKVCFPRKILYRENASTLPDVYVGLLSSRRNNRKR